MAREAKLPARQGALVTEVVPRSPATQAGVKPGDVIVAFQDAEIHDPHELTRRVAGTPPGTEVKLQIARDGGRKVVTTKLAKLPDEPASRPAAREDAPRGPRAR
jgi:serine protease Do